MPLRGLGSASSLKTESTLVPSYFRCVGTYTASWCNGNTTDCLSVIEGSIPFGAASKYWDLSSVGRALLLQGRCREFDSPRFHEFLCPIRAVVVSSSSHGEGSGSIPLWGTYLSVSLSRLCSFTGHPRDGEADRKRYLGSPCWRACKNCTVTAVASGNLVWVTTLDQRTEEGLISFFTLPHRDVAQWKSAAFGTQRSKFRLLLSRLVSIG